MASPLNSNPEKAFPSQERDQNNVGNRPLMQLHSTQPLLARSAHSVHVIRQRSLTGNEVASAAFEVEKSSREQDRAQLPLLNE